MAPILGLKGALSAKTTSVTQWFARSSDGTKRRSVGAGLGNPTASAYMRLGAAASIVVFHTAPGSPVGTVGAIGLAVFVYLSFLNSPKPGQYFLTLKRSAQGLLIPWVFWWLFYAAIAAYIARGIPPILGPDTTIWMLLRGPAVHLWYLPFIFITMNLVNLIRALAVPLPAMLKIAAALSMAVFGLVFLIDREPLPAPFSQMVNAVPAVGLGLAYLWVMRTTDRKLRTLYFLGIAIVVVIACVPIWIYGNQDVAIGYAGGSLAVMLLNVKWPRSRLALRWSLLSMGIYLIHPFALMFFRKFFGTDLPVLLLATMAFLMSSGITWVLMRIRVLRPIVSP